MENPEKKPKTPERKPRIRLRLLLLQGVAGAALLSAFVLISQKMEHATTLMREAEESIFPKTHGLSANYLSGRYAASVGDFKNADTYLSRTMRLDSKNRAMLGYAYRMRLVAGDMAGAAEMAKTLFAHHDKDSNPEIMVWLSDLKSGEYAHAQTVLDSFEKGGFNLIVVPLFKNWMHVATGTLSVPVKLDETLPKAPDFLPFIAYQVAVINDVAGFSEIAEKQYEIALDSAHSAPFRVVEMLGNLYAREGKWDKLSALYQRYEAAHGESEDALLPALSANHTLPERLIRNTQDGVAEILFSTASILKSEHLDEEALIYIQQALYLNPDFTAAGLMRGALLEALERSHDAIATYDALPKDSPYYVRGQLRKAYILSDCEQTDAALSLLNTLAQQKTLSYQVALAEGDILMRKERFAQAEASYSRALKVAHTQTTAQWSVYYARGISKERQDHWKEAEQDFSKALNLQPYQPDVMNYLGYSWLTRNLHVDQARSLIEQAVAARPTDGHIVDSMGWALYTLGDYKGAVDYLERAIELMPNDTTVNDHLGDVYWRLGRKTEAQFQWKRATLSQPQPDQLKDITKKLARGLPPVSTKSGQRKSQQVESPKDQHAQLP